MIRPRRGVTLIELLVVLVILSLMAGVSVMALRMTTHDAPSMADRIAVARREAIARGDPVRVLLRDSSQARLITVFPDGRVIGAPDAIQDSSGSGHGDAAR